MRVPLSPLEFRARAAQLYPHNVGVVDGRDRFTYADFDERVNRLAALLRSRGVRPGDVVSYISTNTHQLLEAYYGVLQAGAVLNPINVRLSPPEIAFVLQHSGTGTLFFHGDFLPLVEALRPKLPSIERYVVFEPHAPIDWAADYEEALASVVPEKGADLDAVDEDSVAELFYTSGTTGAPRGVTLTHRSLYLHGLMTLGSLHLGDADVVLHVVPLFHVNGWGTPHTVTAVGGRHVMMRKFDVGALLRLVEEERVTKLLAVPAIFTQILNDPRHAQHDLSSVQLAVLGGAPSSPSLISAIEEQLGIRAIVGYGLTETSPVVTLAWPRKEHSADRTMRLAAQAKTGLPVVGVRIRVVDAAGRDVAHDGREVGEIAVRSNVVMEGYYKDPAATARAIRDGWFYTGDMAVVDPAGYITIVDRKKDIIVSGGENISSVEVEYALCSHPSVLECAVIGAPHQVWGEVPVAVVVAKPGCDLTEAELQTHVRERLAAFKVPKHVEFVEQLPKGGTGKIQKKLLRDKYWEGQEKRVN